MNYVLSWRIESREQLWGSCELNRDFLDYIKLRGSGILIIQGVDIFMNIIVF